MPKKVTTRPAASAAIVDAALALLKQVPDVRLCEIVDRLENASKALKAEAMGAAPRRQKSLGLKPGDFPA